MKRRDFSRKVQYVSPPLPQFYCAEKKKNEEKAWRHRAGRVKRFPHRWGTVVTQEVAEKPPPSPGRAGDPEGTRHPSGHGQLAALLLALKCQGFETFRLSRTPTGAPRRGGGHAGAGGEATG